MARKQAAKKRKSPGIGSSSALRKYSREIHFNATFLALLTLLERADDELHAYQLGQLLSGLSTEKFPANQAALYPALRTLRRLKLASMRQRKNDHGGQRQHFRITAEGRELLALLWPAWRSSRAFLDLLDTQAPAPLVTAAVPPRAISARQRLGSPAPNATAGHLPHAPKRVSKAAGNGTLE